MILRILIAAGGSGGHLFPACRLADLLQQRPNIEVRFAGHRLCDSPFFPRERYPFYEISSAPLAWNFSWVRATKRGIQETRRLMKEFPCDRVVGFGSYHTAPILCVAAWEKKPMILYEANRVLGKVNRCFAPFAETIASPFPVSRQKKNTLVSLYSETSPHSMRWDPHTARASYGLDPERPTCLVFGGSQGATFLNHQGPLVAERMQSMQWLHFTGTDRAQMEVQEQYQKRSIAAVVKAFEPDMERAYQAADCAICRAGAGTLAELIRYNVPALLIPYPYASQHQEANGFFFSGVVRGGLCLRQKGLSTEQIVCALQALRESKEAFQYAIQSYSQHNQNVIPLDQLVGEYS